MTISYTFNGTIEKSYEAWEQWITDAITICEELNQKINYYGLSIIGKTSGKGKIHPILGLKKSLKSAKEKGAEIEGMTLLVLPDGYESASFDYVVTLSRNSNYLTLIINQDYKMEINEKHIRDILRRNINASCGEVYEMDIYDCPEFYAAKANPKESFESLNVVMTLK